MSHSADLDLQLDAICQSDHFLDWQQRLTICFFDKEAKDALIHQILEGINTRSEGLSAEEVKALNEALIARLIFIASLTARRPQGDESPLTPRSRQEIEDLVIGNLPYPIAACY